MLRPGPPSAPRPPLPGWPGRATLARAGPFLPLPGGPGGKRGFSTRAQARLYHFDIVTKTSISVIGCPVALRDHRQTGRRCPRADSSATYVPEQRHALQSPGQGARPSGGQHAPHHLTTALDQAEDRWLVLLQRAASRRACPLAAAPALWARPLASDAGAQRRSTWRRPSARKDRPNQMQP